MNELVSQINKKKIEAFSPHQIPSLEKLNQFNNIYSSLRVQEEDTRIKIAKLEDFIKKIETNKIPIHALSINIGPAQQHLNKGDKEDFLKILTSSLQQLKKSYIGIEAQRKHRGDELGESRMGVFKMIAEILISQHDFTIEELAEKTKEGFDIPLFRDIKDVEKNISKVEEKKEEPAIEIPSKRKRANKGK